MQRIDEDLDLHAKKKKLLRLADAEFLAGQILDLPKLQFQLRELKLEEIELEVGQPRTEAYIVYVFLMLRSFNGGCKDQPAIRHEVFVDWLILFTPSPRVTDFFVWAVPVNGNHWAGRKPPLLANPSDTLDQATPHGTMTLEGRGNRPKSSYE